MLLNELAKLMGRLTRQILITTLDVVSNPQMCDGHGEEDAISGESSEVEMILRCKYSE